MTIKFYYFVCEGFFCIDVVNFNDKFTFYIGPIGLKWTIIK